MSGAAIFLNEGEDVGGRPRNSHLDRSLSSGASLKEYVDRHDEGKSIKRDEHLAVIGDFVLRHCTHVTRQFPHTLTPESDDRTERDTGLTFDKVNRVFASDCKALFA